ncbi:outer-membrane lipoprotein carrier protein LolA [Hyphomicrobium sp. B1]|jgi:outer membrane lipoprotein-sorting protein|uniref:LolA family protein n=1 Tax=Hyphomicrobium sp. B1 TaxID=3075651 RepID=UPI003C2D0EF1
MGQIMRHFLRGAAVATAFTVAFSGVATAQDPDGPTNTIVNPPATKPAVNGWSSEVAPNTDQGITLDARQTKIVDDVSAYFESLQDLKGTFVQTDADSKKMKGKFFVKRPGRFRFDYALPSRQIIVSDGQNLAIQDLDLNNEDRVSLDQTPFRLLLRKDVNLLRDAKILEVQQSADLIVLTLEDKDPNSPGRIKLFLATKPAMELKEWVTTDAQGQDTRIQLSQLVKTDDLDGNLFKIQSLWPKSAMP